MAATREALEQRLLAEFASSKWDAYETLEVVGAGASIKNETERADFARHVAVAMLRAIIDCRD